MRRAMSLGIILVLLAGCSSRDRGIEEALRSQGFSPAECTEIAKSIKDLEANAPSPRKPATTGSDLKMTVAAAELVTRGPRVLPCLQSRLDQARKAHDIGSQAAYETVIGMINERASSDAVSAADSPSASSGGSTGLTEQDRRTFAALAATVEDVNQSEDDLREAARQLARLGVKVAPLLRERMYSSRGGNEVKARWAVVFMSLPEGMTEAVMEPLVAAAMTDDVPALKRLLTQDDLNKKFKNGATLLIIAVGRKSNGAVQFLLNSGADVNEPAEMGLTPLHAAVVNNDVAMIRLLLSHKANPNAVMAQGWTPLDLAKKGNFPEAASLLAAGTSGDRFVWSDLDAKAEKLADSSAMGAAYKDLREKSRKVRDERDFIRSIKSNAKWSPTLLAALEDTITKMVDSQYDGDVGMRLDKELGATVDKETKRADLPLLMWAYSSLNLHAGGEFPQLCSLMTLMRVSSTAIEKRLQSEIRTEPQEVIGLLMAFMEDDYWWTQREAENIWSIAASAHDPIVLPMFVHQVMYVPDQVNGLIIAEKVAPHFAAVDSDGRWLAAAVSHWKSFNAGMAVGRRHLIEELEKQVANARKYVKANEE